jgi:hypothetical protein
MRILMVVTASIAVLFLMGALIVAVMAPPAQAQGMGKGHKRQSSPEASTAAKPNKADERAYRDALKTIPEKKVDPWGNMR